MKIIRFLVLGIATTLLLSCANQKLSVEKIETSTTQLNKNSEEDKSYLEEIYPYKIQIDKEMNTVLITSTASAVKGQPESELGNLVADIVLKKSSTFLKENVDLCLLNNGGLRTSLPEGEITLGKIFELMPFENEIAVLTLSGTAIMEMFRYVAKSGGVPISGATVVISDSDVVSLRIGSIDFDVNKTYKVATSDYLAGGGDKMKFFNNPISYQALKLKIRDALIEYMIEENKKGNKLNPHKDGRIKKQ